MDDAVLGLPLHEATVTDSTILGGVTMRAYQADWSALGSGEAPWTRVAAPIVRLDRRRGSPERGRPRVRAARRARQRAGRAPPGSRRPGRRSSTAEGRSASASGSSRGCTKGRPRTASSASTAPRDRASASWRNGAPIATFAVRRRRGLVRARLRRPRLGRHRPDPVRPPGRSRPDHDVPLLVHRQPVATTSSPWPPASRPSARAAAGPRRARRSAASPPRGSRATTRAGPSPSAPRLV